MEQIYAVLVRAGGGGGPPIIQCDITGNVPNYRVDGSTSQQYFSQQVVWISI